MRRAVPIGKILLRSGTVKMRDLLVIALLAIVVVLVVGSIPRTGQVKTRLRREIIDHETTYLRRKWLWVTSYSSDGKVWHRNYFTMVRELEGMYLASHASEDTHEATY